MHQDVEVKFSDYLDTSLNDFEQKEIDDFYNFVKNNKFKSKSLGEVLDVMIYFYENQFDVDKNRGKIATIKFEILDSFYRVSMLTNMKQLLKINETLFNKLYENGIEVEPFKFDKKSIPN